MRGKNSDRRRDRPFNNSRDRPLNNSRDRPFNNSRDRPLNNSRDRSFFNHSRQEAPVQPQTALHPSWEAKRKLAQPVRFEGKKIKFDLS